METSVHDLEHRFTNGALLFLCLLVNSTAFGFSFMVVPSGPEYSARLDLTFSSDGSMTGCKLEVVYDPFDSGKLVNIVPSEKFIADACAQLNPHWELDPYRSENPSKTVSGSGSCEYFPVKPDVAFCGHRFGE